MFEGDLCQLYSDPRQSPEPVPQPGPQGRATGRGRKEIRPAQIAGCVRSLLCVVMLCVVMLCVVMLCVVMLLVPTS